MAQQLEWNETTTSEATEQGSAFDVLGVVWRRKWVALCVLVLCVALGYLYFLNATPIFRSETQLLLIKKDAKLSGDSSQRGSPYGGYEDALSTQILLVTSPRVVGQAVEDNVDLLRLPCFQGIEPGDSADLKAAVTGAIKDGLKATRAGDRNHPDPNVMNLAFESPVPEDCATVLDAIIRSYDKQLGEYYKDFSKETLELITNAKDDLAKRLVSIDAELKKVRLAAPWRISTSGQDSMGEHDVQKIELIRARSQIRIDKSAAEALGGAIQTALKTGVNKESLQLLMTNVQLDKMRPRDAVLDKLLASMFEELDAVEAYGEDHPKVQSARKKLSLLREQLLNVPIPDLTDSEAVLKIYLESLKREISLAQDKIDRLTKDSETEGNLAKQENSNRTDEEALKADKDRTDKLFEAVMRRLSEMDIVKDYGGMTMQKLSEPALGVLVKPKLAIILAVAGVFGLFAGVGLCYVIELADRSFRSPDDVRRQLGLPIVGHIPVIHTRGAKHAKPKADAAAGALHPVICTYHQPRSRQAEAYRAVRTSLYFGTQDENHKVIQITSPNPGDGKTTLAANLAVSIADSGKRVLLLDADFRRPKVHKYFGLDNAVGVSTVIAGEAEIPDAIRPTSVENLSAMPCGPRPHNPADLLTSPRFKEMIDLVREQYDFVIVDTPPLLAVTDPSVVAPRVDGVLMVLRLSKHARDSAMRATETLNSLGVRTLGVVINGIGKGAGYGYGSYRYGGYRYGGYRKGYGHGYGYGYGYGSEPAAANGADAYYADDRTEKGERGGPGKSRDRAGNKTKVEE